jgi:DNA-binding transcriptional ArsR family regulator
MAENKTDYQIDEVYTIDDLETVKVVADPLRLRIIENLGDEPRTVKQIAKSLDLPPSKLYYHINLLETHGLIRVVDTRVVSGIIEKLYLVRASMITVNRALFAPGATSDEDMGIMIDSLFNSTAQEFLQSVRAGLIQRADDDEANDPVMMGSLSFEMTSDQALKFKEELNALIERYTEESKQQSRQTDEAIMQYRMLLALFPLARPTHDEADDE